MFEFYKLSNVFLMNGELKKQVITQNYERNRIKEVKSLVNEANITHHYHPLKV